MVQARCDRGRNKQVGSYCMISVATSAVQLQYGVVDMVSLMSGSAHVTGCYSSSAGVSRLDIVLLECPILENFKKYHTKRYNDLGGSSAQPPSPQLSLRL